MHGGPTPVDITDNSPGDVAACGDNATLCAGELSGIVPGTVSGNDPGGTASGGVKVKSTPTEFP